jgi:hypothetical protein
MSQPSGASPSGASPDGLAGSGRLRVPTFDF